ncbi:hypothetical protein ACGFMK_26030 [Amycolatopsis sp. NPDC049252]|uniref:hypothetical protein n=1 Tax=Amycolatopsis sp. NPDC049252 TaxID=3363933 RepID=UPI0037246B47
MFNAVIATMTRVSFESEWERVRADCALKTVARAREHGYSIKIVDDGAPLDYIRKMESLGAQVCAQDALGLGSAVRQALRAARDAASEDDAVVWVEPEKYPIIPLLARAIDEVTGNRVDLVTFRRKSLATYPPEQAMHYELINLAVKYLTGFDCDFSWGPMVMSRRAVEYHLGYVSDHGDLWDSVHCPKLRMIKDGLRWKVLPIDYAHPLEQSEAEAGMTLFLKKIRQVDQLVRAIMAEVDRLGMRAP